MPSRTQLVCLHEGKRGNIDAVFINTLIKTLNPAWLRKEGSNIVRPIACGGRTQLIARMPPELRHCLNRGADTTLMVWADLDDDMADATQLTRLFREEAEKAGISQADFEQVVFVFAKDRLENWIEFLSTGVTNESREGPRETNNRKVADAAKTLAARCKGNQQDPDLPSSLAWSCGNWKNLVQRMRQR